MTYRTLATAAQIEAARNLPEFYVFNWKTVCPVCSTINNLEEKKKNPDTLKEEPTGMYIMHGEKKWKPRRWWRRIGYHKCWCYACGATWRELPNERK